MAQLLVGIPWQLKQKSRDECYSGRGLRGKCQQGVGAFFEGLQELKKRYPEFILVVRGFGLIIGIGAGEYAMKIRDEAMGRGVLLEKVLKGLEGN